MTHEKLDAYIAGLGLAYSAIFIKQSSSRNAGDKNPSLNWSVSVSPNHGKNSIQRGITTDYMQGIAHAPGYRQGQDNDGWKTKYYAKVAETGRYCTAAPKFSDGRIDYYQLVEERAFISISFKPLPAPALRDVLYSLVMDSDVIDYEGFESWAENFGYETDSRKAEKIYNDCMKIALKLRALIGDAALQELKTLFQDY